MLLPVAKDKDNSFFKRMNLLGKHSIVRFSHTLIRFYSPSCDSQKSSASIKRGLFMRNPLFGDPDLMINNVWTMWHLLRSFRQACRSIREIPPHHPRTPFPTGHSSHQGERLPWLPQQYNRFEKVGSPIWNERICQDRMAAVYVKHLDQTGGWLVTVVTAQPLTFTGNGQSEMWFLWRQLWC